MYYTWGPETDSRSTPGGQVLEPVDSEKDVGILIDNALSNWVKQSTTVNMFKNRLDELMQQGLFLPPSY